MNCDDRTRGNSDIEPIKTPGALNPLRKSVLRAPKTSLISHHVYIYPSQTLLLPGNTYRLGSCHIIEL